MKTKNPFQRWTIFRKGSSFLAWVLFLGVTFLGGLLGPSQAQRPFEEVRNDIIPDRFIVVLRDEVRNPRFVADDITRFYGLSRGHVYTRALKGFSAFIPPGLLGAVQGDPDVAFVEPDRRVYAIQQTLPTGVDRIDVDQNATAKVDGVDERVDVDIAIIDTGIDPTHPDLNFYRRTDCVGNSGWGAQCTDGQGDDGYGHGTHVAGTAAALDNGIGVVGVAPGARLWSVRVLDNSGSGYMSWVIAGIDWVTAHADEIEVANMSLGCECKSASLDAAIANSVAAGVTYAVSAGNDANDAASVSPASHPDVITVSAIADSDGKPGGLGRSCGGDRDDTFADFSNFGRLIEIAAPGVCIRSTYRNGGYATMSGTSMASPHVAGAAALVKANNPGFTPAQVLAELLASAVPQGHPDGFTGDPDSFAEPLLNVASGPPNDAPAVSITSPVDRSSFASGETISFVGTASDTEDGNLIASLGWTSNIDGPIGTGGSFPKTLSDGNHTITASVTDSGGKTGSASISISINNDAPVVSITSPADGSSFASGETISFAGTADDTEDGDIKASLDWTSDKDGPIGTGGSLSTTLSDGNHTITASATDSGGKTESASVSIKVGSPTAGPTSVSVDSITYDRGGRRWSRNLLITVALKDGLGGAVAGASVSVTLKRTGRNRSYNFTGTTGADGTVTFTRRLWRGCYTTIVNNVDAGSLTWDGTTPANNYCM